MLLRATRNPRAAANSARSASNTTVPLSDLWPTFRNAWIVHEDADLIVVDKPRGVPTHPPEKGRIDDVHTRLTQYLTERDGAAPYLGIHQRLDSETSGTLLFTRRREVNPMIAAQFEQRTVRKTYVAVTTGKLRDRGELRHRLVAGQGGTMRALDPHAAAGQEAVTRYRVLGRAEDRTLVELAPETGRTHQLRVQLAAIGCPIAGDLRYGGAPAPRLLLHAAALSLRHPHDNKERTFRAERPPNFDAWLRGDDVAVALGADELEARMREAALQRYALACDPSTSAFRIVNDAGDQLPGVTVDVYGDHLVVALLGDEAIAARESILDAAYRLGPKGVYVKLRPKHASRIVDTRRDEVAPNKAVRGDDAPEPLAVHELGLPYEVRLGDGLSTGIFLDQRDNRRRVRELVGSGATVLNLFAYTGAFTVAAVAGGARASTSVDVSRAALAWARRNLDAVGADPAKHELIEADVLAWLATQKKGRAYELILLDPPSFSTTKRSRWSAESDYRGLAARCLELVAPGGRLLACTNHRGISRIKLRRYLHEAARSAGREVAQMKDWPDPSDFPPPPGQECHLKSILTTLR
jgi:23S rRNA (cytosine1962-C5)-methyltransferase